MDMIPHPTGDLSLMAPVLFESFVAWVDRGPSTTKSYTTNLRQFAAWLLFTGTQRPERQDIVQYREWLSAEHDAIHLAPARPEGWDYRRNKRGDPIKGRCGVATVRAYVRTVKQFFTWTAAQGLYPDVASTVRLPRIQTSSHRRDALTESDVLAVEQSITARNAARVAAATAERKDTAGKASRATEQGLRLSALYALAVNAGLRTIELSRANVRDLEVRGGRAWLCIWGKGHSEPDQRKPVAPEVAATVQEYLRIRKDRPTSRDPLFVATGNRSGGRRLSATTISRLLKKAMQEAGYDSERLTAHSLRHTAGTSVQRLSGDLYATQRYMRHSNPATTEIYLHVDTEKEDTELARLLYERYHQGGNDDDGI